MAINTTIEAGSLRNSFFCASPHLVRVSACWQNALAMLFGLVVWIVAADRAGAEDNSDVQRGGEVFRQCMACHQIGVGAKHRIGPHLNDVLGRRIGSLPNYRYSKAFKEAGEGGASWDPATLDIWLAKPSEFLPGSRMSFKGLSEETDRHAVITYLAAFSTGPSNIPETPVRPAPPGAVSADPELSADILAMQGDPAYGEYLAGECVTCHQATGVDKGIPSITGWPHESFKTVMFAYKNKARVHPVMQMVAGRLSAEEIAALAAYFEAASQ